MSTTDVTGVVGGHSADQPEGSGLGRRRFLGYLLAAPTLTVAIRLADDDRVDALPGVADLVDLGDVLILAGLATAYDLSIAITEGERVIVKLPRIETGQGLTTAVAMIVADELDARLDQIDVQLCDAEPARLIQLTGGSNSIRSLYDPMRSAAAAARSRLVAAAANRWGVSPTSLATADGSVRAADGRSATYGELSAEAASIVVVSIPPTKKDPGQFIVIGTPRGRIDARDIVTGRTTYALDLDVAGALPTVVARPPTIGAGVASVDDSRARSMPGVVAIATIPTGVAVSAATFDQALRARDALVVTWSAGPLDRVSDADIRTRLERANAPFLVPPLLTRYADATFEFPYLSHASLEVHTAVADVRPDRAEVWLAAQSPIIAAQTIAGAIGLPPAAVTLHVMRGGGSFGRRLFFEPGVEAAQISKAIGRPVKLLWTRSDDMRHGRFRPASHHRLRATWALGTVLSFEHRMAAAQTDFRHGLGEALTASGAALAPGGLSQSVFSLTEKIPYNFGVTTQLLSEVPLDVPTGSWRSVFSGTFATANEMMVDEVARRMGRDPVQFRRATLASSRLRAVLDTVATMGAWGRVMPRGHGQGIAVHEEFKSAVACLVDVDATGPEPRATKVFVAADVGRCINPTGLEAQLQGAVVDALSVMYRAGNHLDNGRIREGSYADFLWCRMRHTPPAIEVAILPPAGEPGGAGELGFPAACAAAANALARATGKAPRRFPVIAP